MPHFTLPKISFSFRRWCLFENSNKQTLHLKWDSFSLALFNGKRSFPNESFRHCVRHTLKCIVCLAWRIQTFGVHGRSVNIAALFWLPFHRVVAVGVHIVHETHYESKRIRADEWCHVIRYVIVSEYYGTKKIEKKTVPGKEGVCASAYWPCIWFQLVFNFWFSELFHRFDSVPTVTRRIRHQENYRTQIAFSGQNDMIYLSSTRRVSQSIYVD